MYNLYQILYMKLSFDCVSHSTPHVPTKQYYISEKTKWIKSCSISTTLRDRTGHINFTTFVLSRIADPIVS